MEVGLSARNGTKAMTLMNDGIGLKTEKNADTVNLRCKSKMPDILRRSGSIHGKRNRPNKGSQV